jgi:hypothetical protein
MNPIINFRLSPFQLARGLQIIRQLEPNYQLTSISKLVKTLYIDYLAKMSLNKPDAVPQHYLDEIESMLYTPKKPITSLKEFARSQNDSIISTVEDFSPPKDWS